MNRKLGAGIAATVSLVAIVALRGILRDRGAAATFRKTVGSLESDQSSALHDAIEKSYASTLAAFNPDAEESEYAERDERAKRDAEALQTLFTSLRSKLTPDFVRSCEAFVERVAAAQLQLMAFAINRKHRGLPDAAQADAEVEDRTAFHQEATPLYNRLREALT